MDKISTLVNKAENERYREIFTDVGIEATDYYYQKFFEESIQLPSYIKVVRDYTIKKMIKSVLEKYWNFIESAFLTKIDDTRYSLQEHSLPVLTPTDDMYPPAFQAAKEYMEYDIAYSQDHLKKMDKAIINNTKVKITDEEENWYQFNYLEKYVINIRKTYEKYKKQKSKDEMLDKFAYFAYELYYLPKNKSIENTNFFYDRCQKPWCELFWKKKLFNYVYYYNDNLMLFETLFSYNGFPPLYVNPLRQGESQYSACKKKRLISILKNTELKELLKYQYKTRTESVIKYILKELVYSDEHRSLLPLIPPFAILSKAFFFTAIMRDYGNKLTADNLMLNNSQNIFAGKVSELLSISTSFIPVSVSLQFDNLKNKIFVKFQNLDNFSRIFRILFDITDGDLDKLDQLAVVFAKIISGNSFFDIGKIYEKEYGKLPECHPVTVITTNNKYFVYQFLTRLFLFDLNENYAETKSIVDKQINMTKFMPRMHVDKNGIVPLNNTSIMHRLYNTHDYKIRMNKIDLRYVFATNKPKKEQPFHLTFYKLKDLLPKKNLGNFIEDQLYGHLLNICVDDMTVRPANNNDSKRLKNLLNGMEVTYNHPLLGKQKYKSNSNFIFIQDKLSDAATLFGQDFDLLELSQNIPDRCYLFNENEDFTPWEKAFMTLNFALYGFYLLLEQNSPQNNNNRAVSFSVIQEPHNTNIIPEFIKRCCNTVQVDIKGLERATENNATFLRTLHAAYLLFYNEAFGTQQNLPDMKSGWAKNIHNDFGDFKDKCYIGSKENSRQSKSIKIFERDQSKGYDVYKNDSKKNELPKASTDANVCIGLVVKPKSDVINEGRQYKEELERENKDKNKETQKKSCRKVPLNVFVEHLSAITANIKPNDTEALRQFLDSMKSQEVRS